MLPVTMLGLTRSLLNVWWVATLSLALRLCDQRDILSCGKYIPNDYECPDDNGFCELWVGVIRSQVFVSGGIPF